MLASFSRWSACVLMASVLAGCGGSVLSAPDGGDAATTTDAAGTDGGTGIGDSSTTSDSTTTSDSSPDYTTCPGPGTCALVDRTCCGVCGMPKISDEAAVLRGDESKYRDDQCTKAGHPACPGCAEMLDPNLQAFCVASTCTVIDVRTNDVSKCTADSDCEVRVPECCECGASTTQLIGLNKSMVGTYTSQVCAPGTTCAGCVPAYPPKAIPRCDPTTHHCTVLLAP